MVATSCLIETIQQDIGLCIIVWKQSSVSSGLGGREPVHMAQSIALMLGDNLAVSELK